jgi:hypothetical protein
MRPEALTGFQRLMVVSYWMPGSPHSCVVSAISRRTSRARWLSATSPVVTLRVSHLPSPSTACMKGSVTRTVWLAFW